MLEGINPRLVFSIFFVAGLSALLWYDRKNIERSSILFVRRTENGVELLDRIASKFPRFWNVYGWTGVFFAVVSMPLMLLQIGWIVNNFLSTGSAEGGPSAILPGLSGEPSFQAGASFIPVEYWLISVGIIMVVHEASHGIIARLEDFEINSVGWLVMGVIPGAFVEPKGEKMLPGTEEDGENEGLWDQGSYRQRLKVLSAGSFANYVTSAVFFGAYLALILFLLPNFYSGPINYSAISGSPAEEAGLTSGTIQSVNGEEVDSFEELRGILEGTSPGDNVRLETSEGDFSFALGEQQGLETGFIGITRSYSADWQWFLGLLNMVGFLNLAIGMFNLLPAKPLDGGQIVDTLIEEFIGDEKRKYVNHFSVLLWIIVLGSLIAGLIL